MKKLYDSIVDVFGLVIKYTFVGGLLGTGAYNAIMALYAFQTMTPTPTSSGALDTNNDSKAAHMLTTSSTGVFDRATMSLQAVKNNFTTVLADTTTLKTTTNNTYTRVSGEACFSWITPTSTACVAGWTYKTQSSLTIVTGATYANPSCTTAVPTCWGGNYACTVGGSYANGLTSTTYYSVVCCK